MFLYLAISFTFLAEFTLSDKLDSEHNVYCKPVASVVPVEQDGLPYFVTLHRCHGSVQGHNPIKKQCTANASEKVFVQVMSLTPKTVMMENHTECTGACVYNETTCPAEFFNRNKEDCSCTCKYKTAPAKRSCNKYQEWNQNTCECDCKATRYDAPSPRHVLDKERCEFVCSSEPRYACGTGYFIDINKRCRCQPDPQAVKRAQESGQSKFLLPALLIGEFVVLYLIFDFLLYCKKTGLMYYVKTKCSLLKHQSTRQQTDQNQNAQGNGHDSTPLTVQVDQNGTSKVHVTSI